MFSLRNLVSSFWPGKLDVEIGDDDTPIRMTIPLTLPTPAPQSTSLATTSKIQPVDLESQARYAKLTADAKAGRYTGGKNDPNRKPEAQPAPKETPAVSNPFTALAAAYDANPQAALAAFSAQYTPASQAQVISPDVQARVNRMMEEYAAQARASDPAIARAAALKAQYEAAQAEYDAGMISSICGHDTAKVLAQAMSLDGCVDPSLHGQLARAEPQERRFIISEWEQQYGKSVVATMLANPNRNFTHDELFKMAVDEPLDDVSQRELDRAMGRIKPAR